MIIFRKPCAPTFSHKSDRKKEKEWFHLRMSRILSAAQLNDIAHEQTIIYRQLFVGHVVRSRPMKKKKNFDRMISNLW